RRRHTISTRDWSSDVCSSDLILYAASVSVAFPYGTFANSSVFLIIGKNKSVSKFVSVSCNNDTNRSNPIPVSIFFFGNGVYVSRSEERRVGNDGRSR